MGLFYTCSPQSDDVEQSEGRDGCSDWNRVKWNRGSVTEGPLSHSLSLSLPLNEGSAVGPGLTAPSVRTHFYCPPFILPLNVADGITTRIDPPLLSVVLIPKDPEWLSNDHGIKRKGKTKFGSISVTSHHLLGYRGRINSFSLTCLPPCKWVGMASGACKCSTDSVWAATDISLFHTHTHLRFTWHTSTLSVSQFNSILSTCLIKVATNQNNIENTTKMHKSFLNTVHQKDLNTFTLTIPRLVSQNEV